MNDLHLVASASAAGSLLIATRELGLLGCTFCIMDDLSLGPLSDGRERAKFWRTLTAAEEDGFASQTNQYASDEYGFDPADAFATWRHLRQRLSTERPSRVLIWASECGADYVLLRMACYWLINTDASLCQVRVPPNQGYHSVAVHPPEALVRFALDAVPLATSEADSLANEFKDIAGRPEPLREVDAKGRLLFKPISAHDDFLLECCPLEWTLAARVVGDAMAQSDPRNGLGDTYLASRLRHLIDIGVVEVDDVDRPIQCCNVRRRG